jgi:hypothetical protein
MERSALNHVVAALALLASCAPAPSAQAQDAKGEDAKGEVGHGLAVGWDLSSFANNFGLGLRVASPRFAHDKMGFELGAHYAWVQGVANGATDTSWFPYGSVQLGVLGSQSIGSLPLRFYGGGGVVVLLPTDKLSSRTSDFGGYGVTGLELFMAEQAWFVELGAMGTGAKADQLVASPIYANGFTASWGFRYYP